MQIADSIHPFMKRHAFQIVCSIRARKLRWPCRISSNSSTTRYLSALTNNSDDEFLSSHLRIDFAISAKIEGEESQIATVKLRKGETLRAESGAMLFMTKGVEMATSLQGVSSAFSRMMTGQNAFLTDFTYVGNEDRRDDENQAGEVGLGTNFPSKIVRISLDDYGGSLIAQRGAYLASNPSVDIQLEFTKKLSAGFFGGEGFILQRLSGEGDILVKAGGALVEMELEEEEILRVTSGSIVCFESSVEYDIQMMPGVKNVMFGGEGLFVTTLSGPGKIWLQSMPQDRMIAEIASRVPAGSGFGPVIPLGGSGVSETGGAADGGEVDVGDTGGAAAGGEKIAAAKTEALNADRQATVASSGMTGDVGGVDFSSSSDTDTSSRGTSVDSSYQETTFTDDGTTLSTDSQPLFDDNSSFSTGTEDDFDRQAPSDDYFGGDSAGDTEIFNSGADTEEAAEATSSAGGSIFSAIWDIFTGDD